MEVSPASPDGAPETGEFKPYVPASESPRELTWPALLVGAFLGIIFGASSVYLVLKVGLTVSASIPVAVLSITLFRLISRVTGLRDATILENNIVQTTGSAGESIAFGVGVTMPALLLLGFEMSLGRIMLVSILGGLLGILMMIPLRRAFVVQQHKKLIYPEGTACAEVLIVGEKGGSSAMTVFAGFGLGFVYKFVSETMHVFATTIEKPVTEIIHRLKGAVLASDVAPELLGVGYIIGPRISSIMVAGGVLAYLVLLPAIVYFAAGQQAAIEPGAKLVQDMSPNEIRGAYILYIGAGAVAAGGIISMLRVLPTIFRTARASLADLGGSGLGHGSDSSASLRTEQDLSMKVVLGGSLALVVAIVLSPLIGIELLPPITRDPFGAIVGAALIVLCGFLFVTVSSRLTGEIGSSSNPISGMTVAALLITCLVFVALHKVSMPDKMAALSIAAIVCIAASNGGTTSQDLKTGFLVGATPRYQQIAILVGALSSSLVIGSVLKALNDSGTIYSRKPENVPQIRVPPDELTGARERVHGRGQESDLTEYRVWIARPGNSHNAKEGKYLVDDAGKLVYLVDPAINGQLNERDDGTKVSRFPAPKPQLMYFIINGVLGGTLPWELVLLGVLIALTLELCAISSLPFAVGIYLPLAASAPIFVGGLIRWIVDKYWKARTGQGEPDSGPGVLLSSGYIAGGTIAGVVGAFLQFSDWLPEKLNMEAKSPFLKDHSLGLATAAFSAIAILLFLVGIGKVFPDPVADGERKK